MFKASIVSSFRSLLAVTIIFPKPGTLSSLSTAQKKFLASVDRYAKSPESSLIPNALYLHINNTISDSRMQLNKKKDKEILTHPKSFRAKATAQKLGIPLFITCKNVGNSYYFVAFATLAPTAITHIVCVYKGKKGFGECQCIGDESC